MCKLGLRRTGCEDQKESNSVTNSTLAKLERQCRQWNLFGVGFLSSTKFNY